ITFAASKQMLESFLRQPANIKVKNMSQRILSAVSVFATVVILLCASCASKKNLIYLQPDSVELSTLYELNAPKLQPGDILAIAVTADDVRATQPFNQVSPYQGTTGALQATNPFIPTYAIDANGEIDFPKVGKVKLAGKTRTQAMDFLRREVGKYIVDPGISMVVRNF